MVFTCPDCLWSSVSIDDVVNRYCAHCHEQKYWNFLPTPFQKLVISALRSEAPVTKLKQVVAHRRLALASWDEIQLELLMLFNAQRISEEQHAALTSVCQRVMQVRDAVE